MYARNQKAILKLTAMLRALEEKLDNCTLLFALQRELVMRIRRTDKRISKLKEDHKTLTRLKKRGGISREASQAIKVKIAAASEAIVNTQRLNFIWRCFGDGIAYLYQDKHALKQMYYSVENYQPRQSAGAISNKDGFKMEWSILKVFIQRGIPAMLCDVSNVLRHGDVCVLGWNDPFPIEVKSSGNRNARVSRQITSLQTLHDFFKNDESPNLGGMGYVRRMNLAETPQPYVGPLNECIVDSKKSGFAFVSPEKGITYGCFRSPFDGASFDGTDFISSCGVRVMFQPLNETKIQCAWNPYFPFTLSIRDANSLYEFINGDYILAVALDADEVIQRFSEHELDARFTEDPHWAIEVRRKGAPENEKTGLSAYFLSRLFYEFETMAYLINNSGHYEREFSELYAEIDAKIASGELKQSDIKTGEIPNPKSIIWEKR